jgi:hypothetical protein
LSALAGARSFGAVIARTLIATAALGLALAVPGHAASASKDCGLTPRIHGERSQVIIDLGRTKITCAAAKRVMSKYLRSFSAPKPWFCELGHSADDYEATCARSNPSVAMKAYAPS